MAEHFDVRSMEDERHRERNTSQLVHDAFEQTRHLIRGEIQLAMREFSGKRRHATMGGGMFGGAAVFALYGGGALVLCVVLALALVWPGWLAALVTGVALLAVAGVLSLVGRREFRKVTPVVPEQTVANMRETVDTIKARTGR
ncbi:phage holin family protein [Actinoalloteichus spitiensis]|uniref:phage holin family protein n=1 Tax=Actinoalloteichus spitiensis TaxID=252394 RepID=UPI00035FF70D|nr:phage holin family protein [Actinoalloteichus spitiensis]